MSNAQRLLLVVVAVVVVVGGFVLLSPGDDEDDAATTTPVATAPATTTPAATATATTDAPEPEAESETETIRVAGGKPVGGIKTITARKGDRVRIEVSSPDTTAEVHFHGYDITRDLEAGGKVRFSFEATAEGIFEMELEETGTQIAKIEIGPS